MGGVSGAVAGVLGDFLAFFRALSRILRWSWLAEAPLLLLAPVGVVLCLGDEGALPAALFLAANTM